MKTIGFASFLFVSFVIPSFAQRPENPPPPVLVVSGNAQILAAPDEATVRLGVVRQASAAQPAQDQANAVSQQILNAIGKAGVPAQQIQTSRLVLSPVYAPRGPEAREAPRIVGYSASNVVTVRLEDLSLIGPVIDAGLKAGANQLEGVQFGLRNDLPSREQALRQAVNEARSKAQIMADALGVKLIDVLEVLEGGISVAPLNGTIGRLTVAAMDAVPTPVSAGQLEVHANVTIRYRIASKP